MVLGLTSAATLGTFDTTKAWPLPFACEPALEAFEEALDLLVYAEEMLRQGEPRAEVEHVATLARQAAGALAALLRARASAS